MSQKLLVGDEGEGPYVTREEWRTFLASLQTWRPNLSPANAQYFVGAADATLTAERVAVNSPSIRVDTTVAGQVQWVANQAAFGAGYMMGAFGAEDGNDGPPGRDGVIGVNGATGAAGPAGATFLYRDGEDGDQWGLPGPSGATGPSNTAAVELDYVEFTSGVSPAATTEATATTIVTGNSVSYNGSTKVVIEFFAGNARPDAAAAGRTITFCLYEDGTSIGFIGVISTPAASANNVPVRLARRITPSNASHTYSIRAFVSAGTGLVQAGAGGIGTNPPGFIRITQVA